MVAQRRIKNTLESQECLRLGKGIAVQQRGYSFFRIFQLFLATY